MKLKTITILFTAALLLSILEVRAEPFKVPPMSAKESGTMVVEYKEGGTKWTADWTTEQFTRDGENFLKLTFEGKGLLYPFSENVTWVSESIFKAQDTFYPISTVSTVKNTRGEIINIDKKTLDPKLRTVTFERENLKGDGSLIKTYDFTPDTLIMEEAFMALRTFPFQSGDSIKAGFLSNEPELYNVEFKRKGIEKVATSQGEIDCYKLELIPKLGVLGVFKVFFPKTYFWFTVTPPHSWVKYVGYENGRNSPEVVINVVKFQNTLK